MKYFLALLFLLIPVSAQAAELYSPQPKCAVIRNETKDKTFVAIRTDFYTKPDGARSYYEEIMHLKPDEERQVCAKGPFYDGYKVNLIIKSLFPLFDCKTKLEGTIPVREKPTPSGGRDFYAVCVD